MRLLDRSGAIRDADTRQHLECLARDLDVERRSQPLRAMTHPAPCVPQQTVTAIIERSRARFSRTMSSLDLMINLGLKATRRLQPRTSRSCG
jgi:hypothetical protein